MARCEPAALTICCAASRSSSSCKSLWTHESTAGASSSFVCQLCIGGRYDAYDARAFSNNTLTRALVRRPLCLACEVPLPRELGKVPAPQQQPCEDISSPSFPGSSSDGSGGGSRNCCTQLAGRSAPASHSPACVDVHGRERDSSVRDDERA